MPKPVSVGSGTEVVANPEHDRGLHRRFSAEDKQRLLAEAEACTERGALAALLRRERLYSSQLAAWRVQLEREGEAGLAPRKPGRKALKDAKDRRIEALERDKARWHQWQLTFQPPVSQSYRHVPVGHTLPGPCSQCAAHFYHIFAPLFVSIVQIDNPAFARLIEFCCPDSRHLRVHVQVGVTP